MPETASVFHQKQRVQMWSLQWLVKDPRLTTEHLKQNFDICCPKHTTDSLAYLILTNRHLERKIITLVIIPCLKSTIILLGIWSYRYVCFFMKFCKFENYLHISKRWQKWDTSNYTTSVSFWRLSPRCAPHTNSLYRCYWTTVFPACASHTDSYYRCY